MTVDAVVEENRVMPHENIDVASLDVLVGPDHGMIAHLDGGVGLIGRFVYVCEHMNIWSRAFIIGIPFFFLNGESIGDAAKHGMVVVFEDNIGSCETGDIIFPADATHEVTEPGPDGIAVKFTKKGGMVKADPTAPTL